MKNHPVPWFGKNGIWYPLVWRVLDLRKWWPTARFIKGSAVSRVSIDIYLGIVWLVIVTFGILLAFFDARWLLLAALIFASYRAVEIALVLSSELVRRAYGYPFEWASSDRKVLLVLVNAAELFFLFGILHYCREVLWLRDSEEAIGLHGLSDAVYFSVVTGTTLGYGDLSPALTDGIGQFLVSVQPMLFVLIVIGMLSYARGRVEPERSESSGAEADGAEADGAEADGAGH